MNAEPDAVRVAVLFCCFGSERDFVVAAVGSQRNIALHLITVGFKPEEDRPLRRGIPLESSIGIRPGLPFECAEALIVPIRLHNRVRNRIAGFIHHPAVKDFSGRQREIGNIG